MRSFISTFKSARNGGLLKALALFAVVLAVFYALGQWVTCQKPEWVNQDPLPINSRGWDSFSLFEAYGQININNALYYGIGPMIDRARKADVLVLGNSRPMYGFREGLIRNVEKGSGLKFFSLAGPGDNSPFCRDIIVRNGLYPKFIILNEDDFFNPKLWPFQKETMTGSWWHSWSTTYIEYYQWVADYYVHRFIPEFNLFKADRGKKHFLLCSPENGFLFSENNSGGHYPIVYNNNKNALNPLYLDMARKFVGDMRSRGALVILAFVPNGKNDDFIREEARALGVPCILPKVEGLETFDMIHLTPESAEKFGEAFFEGFFKLPEVKKALRESNDRAGGQ